MKKLWLDNIYSSSENELVSKAHSEPCQTSAMEHIAKIINGI